MRFEKSRPSTPVPALSFFINPERQKKKTRFVPAMNPQPKPVALDASRGRFAFARYPLTNMSKT
jgi:hypothetical protein